MKIQPEALAPNAGGIRWHVAAAGPEDGRPVLLLHGFPEDWRSWERQLAPLGSRGFRVLAADLPGFGATDPPPDHRLPALGRLIGSLAAEIAPQRVDLVGHDWGGIAACAAAAAAPDVVRSVVVVAAPHPGAFRDALALPRQLLRSWYVAAFQLPGAPWVLAGLRATPVRRLFAGRAAGVPTARHVRDALSYYRRNLGPLRLRRPGIGRVPQPALLIHAARDRYVTEALARRSARWFDRLHGFRVIDCGHFVHQDCADRFNAVLLSFLTALPSPRRSSPT